MYVRASLGSHPNFVRAAASGVPDLDDVTDRFKGRFRRLLSLMTGDRAGLADAQDAVAPAATPEVPALGDEELEQALSQGRIRTLFQPIVSLADGSVFGYEALSRGPIGTRLENADALFSAAQAVGANRRLERLCRHNAIAASVSLPAGCYLFLNVSPRVLDENDPGLVREVAEQSRLAPERVVLEITEKQAIADFDVLKRTLLHFYRQGFKVAIDDAGAGHSSLRAVTEVRPHFIKLDIALVRDIDRDRAKNALVSAIIIFARRIDAKVLAEGIETVDELATLIEIGVDQGQGFLLGRPAGGFTEPKAEIAAFIRERASSMRTMPMPKRMAISTITRRAPALMATAYTSEVLEIFDRNPDLDSVVLTEYGAPVGLVSRTKLYERLSHQFGFSVYAKRPVRLVMDDSYLAVDAKDSIDDVARKVTHRRRTEMYDEIVVLENGVYSGVVSVRDLLHTMTEFQASVQRFTNPLTGLPGRVPLQQEVDRRSESGATYGLLHVDLNNFRSYNERHGFTRGDEVIALLADVLVGAARDEDGAQAMVGHLGGVNFLVLCNAPAAERIGRSAIERFERRSAALHVSRDTPSIGDARASLPQVTLTIAGITATQVPLPTFAGLATRATRYKRMARSAGSSAFVLDGRLVAGLLDTSVMSPYH
jgi:diguanylate cyclase (GGDEF)-like protein